MRTEYIAGEVLTILTSSETLGHLLKDWSAGETHN